MLDDISFKIIKKKTKDLLNFKENYFKYRDSYGLAVLVRVVVT